MCKNLGLIRYSVDNTGMQLELFYKVRYSVDNTVGIILVLILFKMAYNSKCFIFMYGNILTCMSS